MCDGLKKVKVVCKVYNQFNSNDTHGSMYGNNYTVLSCNPSMYKYFTVPPATFQKLKRRGMQWIPSLRKRKTWELTSKVPKKTRPPNLQQQPRLKDNVCL
ncbi:hypothetical protein AB205_0167620 [Aquarana catesbeiana]|uniref:Uncharacterized protein n=1 Tax=Aquarana catesbeiana TaxID=8400 RepID=A0A2G9Q430_AQUCT|nr:hypothetical protein AB205_0167620 [Aquarana catesbeiana]